MNKSELLTQAKPILFNTEIDNEMRTASISMSIDDEDVVSEIQVQGLTYCEFITGIIAVLAAGLNQAELSEYERDIFKIRLTDTLKMLESEVEENV